MAAITLTSSDNGTTHQARPGDDIEVMLPENPTTGFRWQVDRIDGPLHLEGDTYRADPGAQIGGGGTRVFHFRATGPGPAQLALKNWQAWEGERSVVDRFAATLEIGP